MVGFIDESRMWFGTKERAFWTPVPDQGMTRTRAGRSNGFDSDNGGRSISRTFAHHNVYEMDFTSYSGRDGDDGYTRRGLWVFHDFADGLYGAGFLYFCDPMTARDNLLAPQWGSPMLIARGFRSPNSVEPELVLPSSAETNLAAYGSFEAVAPGTEEVRRNLHTNPRLATNSASYGVAGGVGVRTAITNLPGVAYTYRASGVFADTATRTWTSFSNLTIGDTYTLTATIERLGVSHTVYISEGTSSGSGIPVVPAGQGTGYEEVSVTFVATAAMMSLNVRQEPSATPVTRSITRVLLERTDHAKPFFDGSTAAAKGFTYGWVGTANASASVARASRVEVWRNYLVAPLPSEGYWLSTSGEVASIDTLAIEDGQRVGVLTKNQQNAAGIRVGYNRGARLTQGQTVTIAARVKMPAGRAFTVSLRNGTSTTAIVISPTITATGDWQTVRVTGTATANSSAYSVAIVAPNSTTIPIGGEIMRVMWASISPASSLTLDVPRTYATAMNIGDFQFMWVGTINEGESVMLAVRPAGLEDPPFPRSPAIWSAVRSVTGDASTRSVFTPEGPTSANIAQVDTTATPSDSTYTIALWAYKDGGDQPVSLNTMNGQGTGVSLTTTGEWQLLRATFTTWNPSNIIGWSVNYAPDQEFSVWADGLTIVPGDVPGLMPFDGDSPGAEWTGTPYASTSASMTYYDNWRNFPSRAAQWNLTPGNMDDEWDERLDFTLLIPPGHRLWMCAIGEMGADPADNAGVFVTGGRMGTDSTISSRRLPLISPSAVSESSPLPFVDMTYFSYLGPGQPPVRADWAEVRVGRQRYDTINTASFTILGMMAVILPESEAPAIYEFSPGRGTTGLRFSGDATPEEYVMSDRTIVSIRSRLEEVEQWSPPE